MKFKEGIYIHFLVEKELKEQLQKEAKEKGLPLNGYIRMILNARKK